MRALRVALPLVVLLAAAACTTAKMMHPAPVAVPPGLTQNQVAIAVKEALTERGWLIVASTETWYTAKLTGNGWSAVIRTPYDTHQVSIEYVSSTGLKHSTTHGTETINRHWNNWMVALVQTIRLNLAAAKYPR